MVLPHLPSSLALVPQSQGRLVTLGKAKPGEVRGLWSQVRP